MRRVVVTGMGMVTPLGCGVETTWQRLIKGDSGAKVIDTFEVSDISCKIAGVIPRGDGSNGTFNADQWMEPKEQRKVDDFIVFAMCAAKQALDDAGWRPESYEDQTTTGVLIGSGIGGIEGIADVAVTLHEKGPRRVTPFFIPGRIINLASGYVSIANGLKGPNHAVVTACSTGAHAIGDAARLMALGDAEVMVAGGAESPVNRISLAGFAALRALSTGFNDQPTRASRPYDKDRDGFVMGEGAGAVVVEELEHAQARGAKIYAELIGYGMSGDAYHITAPAPDGDGAFRCMTHGAQARRHFRRRHRLHQRARHLDAARRRDRTRRGAAPDRQCRGDGVDVVDEVLRSAICSAPPARWRRSSRSWRSAIGVAPPTINLDNPSVETPIDLVPHQARKREINIALSNSFGFGGTNASLIFTRYAG